MRYPEKPTDGMIEAGRRALAECRDDPGAVYAAMRAAWLDHLREKRERLAAADEILRIASDERRAAMDDLNDAYGDH